MTGRIVFGIVVAGIFAIIAVMPFGQRLEQNWGLKFLYEARGPISTPNGAVIIALDNDSVSWLTRNLLSGVTDIPALKPCLTSHAIGMLQRSRNTYIVPRALYICLLREIAKRNADQVVFDIKFNADRPDDQAFAAEIARSGRVYLIAGIANSEFSQISKPAQSLADAAKAVTTFRIDGTEGHAAAHYLTTSKVGEVGSLPLQVLLDGKSSHILDKHVPKLQPLWFYGGAGSITTIPLRAFFDPDLQNSLPRSLIDNAVFIGVSDRADKSSPDHFEVPLSLTTSSRVSGVEIAATGYLNLLHGDILTRITPIEQAFITFSISTLIISGIIFSGKRWSFLLAIGIAGCYSLFAALTFTQAKVWLPLVIPVSILPVTLACNLALRHAQASNLVRRLAPIQIANKWLSESRPNPRVNEAEPATVMFIDLAGSTTMGEKLGSDKFAEVLSVYYDSAARSIEAQSGLIIEFAGDGIIAIFLKSVAGPDHARKGCIAALTVSEAVQKDGLNYMPEFFSKIQLRFGVHTGQVSAGAIGSQRRFSFNALGDSMNVAARLEQHGKTLKIENSDIILASGETILAARSKKFAATPVGCVQLRGRTNKTDVFRITR